MVAIARNGHKLLPHCHEQVVHSELGQKEAECVEADLSHETEDGG